MHLQAADGWLDLGDASEANAELDKISDKLQAHPDVLEFRWNICSRTKDWEACLKLSRGIMQRAPERVSGWLNYSIALHELKMTQQAWDSLFSVAEKFPNEPTLAYNLACYAAQLGREWEAEQWLKQAFKVGEPRVFKPLALADPDLKPIWSKIEKF
jgi:uncharacterized protein HemY